MGIDRQVIKQCILLPNLFVFANSKYMELPEGIEPSQNEYKSFVLPLNYGSIFVLVCPSSQASFRFANVKKEVKP